MTRDARKRSSVLSEITPLVTSSANGGDTPTDRNDSLFNARKTMPLGRSGRPRTLFVTSYRRGAGKTLVAAGIARACTRSGCNTAEWQLATGVVVPRQRGVFGRPIPHASDKTAFDDFTRAWQATGALILDGPVSLLSEGDPFALCAEEFLVLLPPGSESMAECYGAIKQIFAAAPDARIRVLANKFARASDAQDGFHKLADVAARHLGHAVRSYGSLGMIGGQSQGTAPATGNNTAPPDDPVFARIARTLLVRQQQPAPPPMSYFESVWARQVAASA
jgi:hypothetical protein